MLTRFIDVLQSLPTVLVALVVVGIYGGGLITLIVLLGILLSPIEVRILRGQALALMAMPFIDAARVLGASPLRIILFHLVPNLLPLMIVSATTLIGIAITAEATLSFLGFGLPPPYPSWGQMLGIEGREYFLRAPQAALFPGIALTLVVFAVQVLGDALRDVLDPRLRGLTGRT
jgi:peptide/nickel transport system permease protein